MRTLLVCIAVTLCVAPVHADDWPQWLGPKRDGVWRETGLIEKLPATPKYRWKTPIGAGYAGPAVVGGKVYVHDRILKEGTRQPTNAFALSEVPGSERVHCLNLATGKIVWTHSDECSYRISYSSGPRCTPLIAGDRIYTLGAMGHLLCLNTADGKVVWQKQLMADYDAKPQIWGFSASPLLDGDRLICLVGGKGGVVAFNKDTGAELWTTGGPTTVGYAPPMIHTLAGKRQLVIWTPEAVSGHEIDTGKELWSHEWKLHQSGLSIPTPIVIGDRLFLTAFYNSARMLEIGPTAAKVVWQGKSKSEKADRTETLHSIMPTPVIQDGHIYGVCSYGELRCLKADTGERVWETRQATRPVKDGKMVPADKGATPGDRWGNAFLTPQADRFWLFNEHGDLILAKLSPKGYEEQGRMNLLKADNKMAQHPVVWSHPAYADRAVFARNDSEIVCVELAAVK